VVETAPEVVEPPPEVIETAPEIVEPAPEVVEVVPEVIEPAPEDVEVAPEVVEQAPEEVETAPEVVEPPPEVIETAPEIVEPAPEVVEPPPDIPPDIPPDLPAELPPACTPGSCDDNNVCTKDTCDPQKGCANTPMPGATCDDGDACTETDTCADAKCTGKPKNCDDGNVCTSDACDKTKGCTAVDLATAVTCTLPDSCGATCEKGKCTALPEKLFTKLPNAAGDDYLRDVLPLADGFLLAGTTSSNSKGGFDAWFLRTDLAGNKLWEQKYGEVSNDFLHRTLALKDGFVFVGTTQSKGQGGGDVWLVRTDLNGAVKFDKTYGGAHVDEGLGVLPFAPSNGFLVFGRYKSPSGGAVYQPGVAWTDASGNQGGLKYLAEAAEGSQEPQQAVVSGGILFVAGPAVNGQTKEITTWLRAVSYDANLKTLWKIDFGKVGETVDFALAPASSGGVVLATTIDVVGKGGQVRLVRVDASGNIVWDRAIGGASAETPRALQQLDTGYVLAAATTSIGAGNWDTWLVRLDGQGQPIWDTTLGGTSEDVPHDVAVLPDGLALVGHTLTPGGGGVHDAWFARTDAWGHPSCKAAGKCLGLAEAACDDKVACTNEACDGVKGCVAPVAPDGTVCGDDKACVVSSCGAGKCAKTSKGKLFKAVPPFAGGATLPLRNAAGWLVAGRETAGLVGLVQMNALGESTSLLKIDTKDVNAMGFAAADGLFTVINGNLIRKYDMAGKQAYLVGGAEFAYQQIIALLPEPGGGMAVIAPVQCQPSGTWVTGFGGYRFDSIGKNLGYSFGLCPGSKVAATVAGDSGAALGFQQVPGYSAINLYSWKIGGPPGQPLLINGAGLNPGGKVGGTLQALDATADGGWVLGGAAWDDQYGGGQSVIIRVDAAGKQTSTLRFGEKTVNGAAPVVNAVAEVPGGYLVLRAANNGWTIASLTTAGTVLWQRPWTLGNVSRMHAVPGGFAMLQPGGSIVRSDTWGYIDCSSSGSCFATAADACADTDPCTLDACTGPGGCTHTQAPDGMLCGNGKVCLAGKCTELKPTCGPQTTPVSHNHLDLDWTVCAPDYPKWGVGPDSPTGWKDSGSGTVLDPLTGLQWTTASYNGNFATAVATCSNATVANKTDWRLPTRTELRTLVDYTKPVAPYAVTAANVQGMGYWSATPAVGVPYNYWAVGFGQGGSTAFPNTTEMGVKCVRGP
jgi:hypothetical protein